MTVSKSMFEMNGKPYLSDTETLKVLQSLVPAAVAKDDYSAIAAVMQLGLVTGRIVERGEDIANVIQEGVMSTEQIEWGWYSEDRAGNAHGPFASRAEALADACEYFADDAVKIIIGRIEYLSASKCVPDLDSVLDIMEEQAWERYNCDERVFDPSANACKALHQALIAWAVKYLTWPVWFSIDREEEVDLNGGAPKKDTIESAVDPS